MAVDALPGCLAALAYVFETDYDIHNAVSISTDLLMSYSICVYCFLLCWLGLYLFSLAVFRVQLKKTKHEAIGLVTVLVTPLTFLWVLPWKTESYYCEYKYRIKISLLYNISIVSSMVVTTILIGAVLIMLCRNTINRAENTLQQQHKKAVRKTIPLVIFVSVHQISANISMCSLAYQLFMAKGKSNKSDSFFLWPVIITSLPILLVYQLRIHEKISCKRQVTADNENAGTIGQSSGFSQPSDTYYSVPHEHSVSYTCESSCIHVEHERQPLLNRT